MFKILIPEAMGIYQTAAEIFAGYSRKITGRTPEIITVDDETSDLIVLGNDAEHPFVLELLLAGKVDSLGIRYDSDDYSLTSLHENNRNLLLIAGGRGRSLLYGVYDYLERCGCSWFWDEDFVPELDELPLTGFSVKESPRFEYRGLRYFAHRSLHRFQAEHWNLEDWKREIDWIVKKRLNFFMLRIGMDDIFQKAFPETVPYPDPDRSTPTDIPRSFNDRTQFWSLEERGKLRAALLQYARERDLMHPEDTGTMSHWYSRTPQEFLDSVKPEFMPQANITQYGEPSGLVWDIRQQKHLDDYFKLTEAHIEHYGSPELFHTIGLAERLCYRDHARNHLMKLYTYRRIIGKLRSRYSSAPLMLATWDFICYWTPEEVRSLIRELNPRNTMILDYTSDSCDELNNFQNWNLVGNFPWTFGIFHAFEANTEMRGNYNVIERRLPAAAKDPMCRGMVYWPESSHTDTLMLEYFAANSWNPENFRISDFLEVFCRKRYRNAGEYARMTPVWRTMLPLIRSNYWRQNQQMPVRGCLYVDYSFRILEYAMTDLNVLLLENHEAITKELNGTIRIAPMCFRMLGCLDYAGLNRHAKRDWMDLARCAVSRLSNFACGVLALRMEAWRNGEEDGASVLKYAELIGRLLGNEKMLLGAHEDFSLYASLLRMQESYRTNPGFESTLKGNAENSYCRSFIYELFDGCYIPEFECYCRWLTSRITSGDRSPWRYPEALFSSEKKRIGDRFYNTPLADLAPDREHCIAALPGTLAELVTIADEVIVGSEKILV
ncbi:MAG TPA: hypothetical protein DE060_11720 [Lentisphaeria bacterium]|nr:hypothetical protein [Lentisphaeria bacterium]HCG49855.1 hypothetical protein [Lentisphaeria bacterium]